MTEHEIGWSPERLDLLWGRRQASTRGPKPSLTVEQVVRAAIDLADADGLDALSMKAVAARLGVGTMSLYTYVPDKGTLLELMLDATVAEVALPDPDEGWRQYLRGAAEAILDVYLGHPWTLRLSLSGPPISPNQMRYLETTLRALQHTGLDDREMVHTAMTISYYALGVAKLVSGIVHGERESGLDPEQLDARYQAAFLSVLDPDEFPLVLRVLTGEPERQDGGQEAALRAADPLDELGVRFGLERLLDGIEAHIANR